MATQLLAWEGMYAPLKPWRFDTGYPQLVLYRGDDVTLEVTCAMRDGSALFADGAFARIPVDLTGAKLSFSMVPADDNDPVPTPIVKTNATGGGVTIVDAVNGVAQIALAAADTVGRATTIYRAFLRAQWGTGSAARTGTVAQGPVLIIDPNATVTDFTFTAGQ